MTSNMYSHYQIPTSVDRAPPMVPSPAKGAPKQIHRNRASYSCHSCRRRKVKCDRQHPICGGCVKMGVPCEWSDNTNANGQQEDKASPNQLPLSPPGESHSQTTNPVTWYKLQEHTNDISPPRGHKRQRTLPNAQFSEDSDSPYEEQRPRLVTYGDGMMPNYHGTSMAGMVPQYGSPDNNSVVTSPIGPHDQEKQLAMRMDRLVGIVIKWLKDDRSAGGSAATSDLSKENLQHDIQELEQIRRGDSFMPEQRMSEFPSGTRLLYNPTELYQTISGQSMQATQDQRNGTHVQLEASSIRDRPPHEKGLSELAAMYTAASDIDPQLGLQTPNKMGGNVESSSNNIPLNNVNPNEVEVENLTLGHLSIQEDGRTRYVGSTFWAFISNEITELNQVLGSRPKDRGYHKGQCPAKSASTRSVLEATHDPSRGSNGPQGDRSNPVEATNNSIIHREENQPFGNSNDIINTIIHPDGSKTCIPPPSIGGMTDGSTVPMALLCENSTLFPHTKYGLSGKSACQEIPKLLKYLPTKAQSFALYNAFLSGVHPVFPLLHIPSFDAEFKTFWDWYPDKFMSKSKDEAAETHKPPKRGGPTFFPLLFSVLFAGSLSISSEKFKEAFPSPSHTRGVISTHLYTCTTTSLTITAFPRHPTPKSLIAFLIINTCLIREEEPLTSFSFVGVAMRTAHSMGLHRDGSLFRGLNEIEKEVRRRIWWHIVYLDVQAAVATGLPPLGGSDDSVFDTKMISELKDELIGVGESSSVLTNEELLIEEERICESTHDIRQQLLAMKTSIAMIAAVGRFETTLVLRKLVVNLFGLQPPDKQKISEMGAMISELRTKLNKRINRIPARGVPELGVIHPNHSEDIERSEVEQHETFNSWARTVLSLLGDKAFGVLYQPFLKSTKSKLWQFARQCALRSCHSFLQKYMLLSTSPSFQPYNWFIPGTYQPLHATMIILLDLYERPFSAEAKTHRHHLDQVFNLTEGSAKDGKVTNAKQERTRVRPSAEGGKEAWEMMGRLRRKAYARAGFDGIKSISSGDKGGDGGAEGQASDLSNPGGIPQSRQSLLDRQDINLVSLPSPPDSMKDIVSPMPLPNMHSPIDPAILMPYSIVPNSRGVQQNGSSFNDPSSHVVDYSDVGSFGAVVSGFTQSSFRNSSKDGPTIYEQQRNFQGTRVYPERPQAGSANESEDYFPLASIGGISVDSSGAPVILAPGMNMNMDTGQVHVHSEDGGSFGIPRALNSNSMLMDMSTSDFDWTEWDAVFGTYVATMQADDDFQMRNIFGQQGYD